ncbi:MAG: RNA pseudouridine synthase, partial [Bacteroidales bacterium]|nr:RNA pseudouridine synthase [Bacteroidales bacterium]
MTQEENYQDKQEENNDFYEHHRISVDPGQQPLRIDKFLMHRIENATRNKIQLAIKAGNVLVNETEVKPNYKVKPDDVITVVLSYPPREIEVVAEDIPLNIVYEDDDVLIVNKKAGMVVHPAYANYTGTLVNALAFYLQNKAEKPQEDGPFLV